MHLIALRGLAIDVLRHVAISLLVATDVDRLHRARIAVLSFVGLSNSVVRMNRPLRIESLFVELDRAAWRPFSLAIATRRLWVGGSRPLFLFLLVYLFLRVIYIFIPVVSPPFRVVFVYRTTVRAVPTILTGIKRRGALLGVDGAKIY